MRPAITVNEYERRQIAPLLPPLPEPLKPDAQVVAVHTHEPPEQVAAPGHTTPQPPQLLRSLRMSAHAVPQHAVPGRQVGPPPQPMSKMHRPDTQRCPAPHTTPHPPQFAGSTSVRAQRSTQQLAPAGHAGPPPQPPSQRPIAHICPAPHATPHPPQLVGSLVVNTQRSLQHVPPGGHPGRPPQLPTQRPIAQRCPGPHATPQPPQLVGSLTVSTQRSLQHAPFAQGRPGPHSGRSRHAPD